MTGAIVVLVVGLVVLVDTWRRRAIRLSRKVEAQRQLLQATESRLVRAQVINAVFLRYLRGAREKGEGSHGRP